MPKSEPTKEEKYRAQCEEDRKQLVSIIKRGGDHINNAIRAAVAAERERCAVACENIGKEIVCPEECAAAIRALGESEDDPR